jgi:hypothetical protein
MVKRLQSYIAWDPNTNTFYVRSEVVSLAPNGVTVQASEVTMECTGCATPEEARRQAEEQGIAL